LSSDRKKLSAIGVVLFACIACWILCLVMLFVSANAWFGLEYSGGAFFNVGDLPYINGLFIGLVCTALCGSMVASTLQPGKTQQALLYGGLAGAVLSVLPWNPTWSLILIVILNPIYEAFHNVLYSAIYQVCGQNYFLVPADFVAHYLASIPIGLILCMPISAGSAYLYAKGYYRRAVTTRKPECETDINRYSILVMALLILAIFALVVVPVTVVGAGLELGLIHRYYW